MASRFLTPTQISTSDAPPAIREQAAFISLLRDVDTALASTAGLHVAEFATEHGIPESEVLQNLKLLTELGYPPSGLSRGHRHVLQYRPGQRRLFLAPLIRAAPPRAKLKSDLQTGERLCDECGKPFTSKFSQTVTCGAACSFTRNRRISREKAEQKERP